jgi:hypothetical protein
VKQNELDMAKKMAIEKLRKSPFAFVLFKTGMGLGFDGVLISLHEDYASFDELWSQLRKSTEPGIVELEVFLTSLDDAGRYLPLTFSLLAKHVLSTKDKQK